MGCGATKESLKLQIEQQASNASRVALQSTGGLQLVLQQSLTRKLFREFVNKQWTPSKGVNLFYIDQARKTAISCLEFWVDARDFCKIKKSPFRSYRAVYIFEQYIMHGAVKQVPVSINVVDDCITALFNIAGNEEVESDVFTSVETEALDYLVSEVFPYFEKTSYSIVARKQKAQVLKYMMRAASEDIDHHSTSLTKSKKNKFSTCSVEDRQEQLELEKKNGRPRRAWTTAEKHTLTELLHKILSDQEYLASYRAFLVSQQEERVLLAYNEAVEISEKLTELPEIPDHEVRQSILFHMVNVFYSKYIAPGGTMHVRVTQGTLGDFIHRLANYSGIEQEVLLPIEHDCFEYMMRVHLEPYLASPGYRQLVRAGRRTVLLMFYHMKVNAEHCAHLEEPANYESEETKNRVSASVPPRVTFPRKMSRGRDAHKSDRDLECTPRLPTAHENEELEAGLSFPNSPLSVGMGSPISPINHVSLNHQHMPNPTAAAAASSPPPPLLRATSPQRSVNSLNSEELTAWLARGGRRSSTLSSSTGSSGIPLLSPSALSDLLASVNHTDLRELKNFIRSGYDELLGRYLESKGALCLMHFYQSAARYQEARFNHDVERLSESTMLFERYISRNAEDKIALPEPIRCDIVKHLLRGKQTIYALAAKWALHSICAEHWSEFKREVYTAAMVDDPSEGRRDSQLLGQNTLGSVQITSMEDGSISQAAPVLAEDNTGTNENSLNSIPMHHSSTPKAHATPTAHTAAAAAAPTVSHSSYSTAGGAGGGAGGKKGMFMQRQQQHHQHMMSGFHDSDNYDAMTSLAAKAAMAFPVPVRSPSSYMQDKLNFISSPTSSPDKHGCINSQMGFPVLLSPVPLPAGCDKVVSSQQLVVAEVKKGMAESMGLNLNLMITTGSEPMCGVGGATEPRDARSAQDADMLHPRTPFNSHTHPGQQQQQQSNVRSALVPIVPISIPECSSISIRSRDSSVDTPHHSVHSAHRTEELKQGSVRSRLISMTGMTSGLNKECTYEIIASNSGKLRRRAKTNTSPVLTVRTVLEHGQCCSVLKTYLDREGLAQTVLFFTEVEEFRRIPSFDFQLRRARKIFSKYMHEMAAMPVPVTTFTRNEIMKCISGGIVLPTLFKCAAEEVVHYIEVFQFPRFRESPEMRRVMEILQAEQLQPVHAPRRSSLTMHAMPLQDTKSLRNILKNQSCTRFFKDFCSKMFCTENLLFWLDVENYSHLPGSDYMRRVACKIYKKYIDDGAKMQVNVSYSVKQKVFVHLLEADRNLFKKAQLEVFQLMRADTLPKFIISTEYALMAKFVKIDQEVLQQHQGLLQKNDAMNRRLIPENRFQEAPNNETVVMSSGNLSMVNWNLNFHFPGMSNKATSVGVLHNAHVYGKSPTAVLKYTSKPVG